MDVCWSAVGQVSGGQISVHGFGRQPWRRVLSIGGTVRPGLGVFCPYFQLVSKYGWRSGTTVGGVAQWLAAFVA